MVIVAGLSLGLGVGATTTMYSVVNRVANYELGFAGVDRLVVLWSTNPERGIQQQPPNWEIVRAILEHGQAFESFGFFQDNGAPVTLAGTTETSRVSQMPVDVNGLSVVGVRPLLGRTYRLEDFDDVVKQKEARAIVISYDTWQRRLGGASGVIGTSIHVDGEPRTIIGVMPRDFALVPWEDRIAFWAANDLRKIPEARWMTAVGRLKPGVSIASAQAEATAITRQVLEGRGEKPGGNAARVVPLHDAFFGGATNGLTFLLGAVSFVLLIACANVANLLLAAGTARQKEMALRAATGARHGRLVQQLLTENLLLAFAGCGFGLALAFWGTRDLGNPSVTFAYATQVPAMLDEFAIGICIARLHVDGTMARWTARFGVRPLLLTACAFAIAVPFVWDSYWASADYWASGAMVVFWRTGLALTFGALVLLAAQLPDMTRLLPLRPLNYLGEISYGIYLWHLPVLLTLKNLLLAATPATLLVMTLAVVIALSAVTWRFLEQPIIRRLR
jgi:hypothetical protein